MSTLPYGRLCCVHMKRNVKKNNRYIITQQEVSTEKRDEQEETFDITCAGACCNNSIASIDFLRTSAVCFRVFDLFWRCGPGKKAMDGLKV